MYAIKSSMPNYQKYIIMLLTFLLLSTQDSDHNAFIINTLQQITQRSQELIYL